MFHVARKSMVLVLIAFVAGCESPQPNVAVVAQTLQTYEVGKTTFADFKKDAGLVLIELPAVKMPPPSYLNPQPYVPAQFRKPHKAYETPKGSPWRIYQTGQNTSLINGIFSHTYKYVVGDIYHPISILAFDERGNLTSISPVNMPNPSLEPTAP